MNIKQLNEAIAKALNEEYDLVGINGNAFSVISYVVNAMKEQGFSKEEIEIYRKEATELDYDNLLATSVEKIDECNKRLKEKEINNGEKEAQESDTILGPQSGDFTVTFGPGTYYIGDICYCLNDEEYDGVWGKQYEYKDGAYGYFAVGGTAYGDGVYYGGIWEFPVDAGVIGVVDMTHSKESAETLEKYNYGCVLTVSKYLTFDYDGSGVFNFKYDGNSFSINTQATDEDDEDEDEEDTW